MKTNFQKYLFPAILCLLSSITYAAKTVKVHTDPLSNINISVTYIHKHLGTGPTGGFLPVLINIDNSSLNQHTWTLTQRPDNYNNNTAATTHFTVAPRSRTRFNYNLPLSGTNNDRYYPYLNFSGFGIKKTQSIGGYQVEVANGAMISNRIAALAPKSIDLEPFNEIAPNLIPNQWQGLHNLSAVILDIQDWTSLNESQKSAIKDWIIAGGELIINESSPNSQLYLLKDF
ncbi:MAG: hypothetical protein HRT88_22690, partial [Lentisphaeraceae bacterium]|nr:hypothetical protein [Lentisphaeraceae bacterium]